MSDEHYYKVGGSLEYQHPTYVVRQADTDLYDGLTNGEFCYVLNSRQMGKSSLRVQMMKKLKEQGFKCASIDMTRIGSHVTPAEWYAGVVSELLRGFGLGKKVNFSSWWRDREMLPPLQRLSELIEDVLLAESSQKLVIFIDEIDSIIKIKFKEDFFAFIRACYNQRVDNPEYNRLTFCLLGVATPSDLIEDRNLSTPFNIGRAIELTGFQLHEATPLAQGLAEKTPHPQALMREVLAWTGGQPFLTQKVCKLILNAEGMIPDGNEVLWVENLVRSRLIENWETQDEPEHLRTVRDRILWSQRKGQLLQLYQQILQSSFASPYQGGDGGVKAKDTPAHMELRLSGLVVKQQGKLRVYNRIYASVFNETWVENALAEAGLLPKIAETPTPSKVEISKSDIQTIEQAAFDALQQFEYQQIEALLLAMQAGQKLKALIEDNCLLQNYPTISPLYALQMILDNIRERNRFNGHQGQIFSVSFSPNGQRLATAGENGTVLIWNFSGQQLTQLSGHQDWVRSVSFSPNGQHLATAGDDGTVRVWDLSGRRLVQLNGHQGWVMSVSFSPNGQYLATAGEDGTVRIWDLSGQQLAQCEKTTSEEFIGVGIHWVMNNDTKVMSVLQPIRNSPAQRAGVRAGDRLLAVDGKSITGSSLEEVLNLLIGEEGTKVKLRLSRQGRRDFDLSITRAIVPIRTTWFSVCFSSDGQRIASASEDGTVKLWNLSGRQLAQWKGETGATSLSFNSDGQRIASVSEDGTVTLWNLSGQQLAQLKSETRATSVTFSADGQLLVTAGEDGTVQLWNLAGQQLAQLRGHQNSVRSVNFSRDGEYLATAGEDGTTRLWDLSDKHLAQWNSHQGKVWSVSFSPDGECLATVGADSSIRVWNLQGKQLAQVDGHQGWVRRVSFSPDGQRLATSGYDGTVRLWNLEGQQIVLNGHQGRVNSVSFSPDGQHLATAGYDGTVRFWNLQGQQLRQLNTHHGKVYDASFSPDGQCLATAGADGIIRLWNLSGQQLLEFKVHRGWVYSLSFSPDSQCLTTGGTAGTIRLWDLSGHELTQWQGHQGTVYCISFHPNSQQIATAGADGMVKLWDLSGRQLAQWQSPNNSVYSTVSFSPDGQCLAAAGTGGLQIWRIGGLDELLARGCDWLKDYFVTHPEAIEKLGECQNRFKSIETGKNLDQATDAQEATSDRAATPKQQTTSLPQQDELQAIAQLSTAPELSPALDSDPKTEVRKLAAKTLVGLFGEILSRQGDIEKAVAAYAEAQTLDPTLEIPAAVGNNLCWWGSLWGNAAEVMDACETAVALEPENAMFRDSRGLARALTGNMAGAIEDFQAFVDWTQDEEKRLKRQRWIDALRAGENPFTEEEIESLFNEYNVAGSKALEEFEVHQDQLSSVEANTNLAEVGEDEDVAIANLQRSAQTSNTTSKHILWVDDKPANIANEIAQLKQKGLEVTEARSTAQAMQILVSSGLSFNAIISDMSRTEEGEYRPNAGISLIKAVREAGIHLPILIYTTLDLYARTINEVVAAGGNGATMSAEELFAWLRDYTNLATKGDIEDSLDKAIPKGINNLPSCASVVCDRLNSECGIDYTRLRDLLAAEQWLEADLETTALMLRISGREAEGWLREEDIEKFPCTDLVTIDQLWVKYSKGRFGFSVQKKIWESLGGKQNAEYRIYRSFSKGVGWSDGSNSWIYYSDLTFNRCAVEGHLPGGLLDWLWYSYRNSRLSLLAERASGADGAATHTPVWWNIIPSIASRLSECNI